MATDSPERPPGQSRPSVPSAPAKAGTGTVPTPLPLPMPGVAGDPRTLAAWKTWLAALAEDAEAAMAAALTYEGLGDQGRLAWLDALDADAPLVQVPRVALYAPLLGVERDEARRARIMAAMTGGDADGAASDFAARSARAFSGDGVSVLVWPLYLAFVELLVCRFDEGGIADARHEPLVHERDVPSACARAGVGPEAVDLEHVVEALAHAVVADGRAGRTPRPAVVRFSHLFDAQLRR
jgi:hypothetical protein